VVNATTVSVPSGFILVFGALALVSLVPIVWAIVDVVRRPAWQFSAGRKVIWTLTLSVGWVLLWPLALVSAIVYLAVLRRRFPPAAAGQGPGQGPGPPWQGQGQGQGPYPMEPPSLPRPRDLPPAGWYPDPSGRPGERWWDGVGWSDRTR
jgi:hypothetical protein